MALMLRACVAWGACALCLHVHAAVWGWDEQRRVPSPLLNSASRPFANLQQTPPDMFDDVDDGDLFAPVHNVEQAAIDKGRQDGIRWLQQPLLPHMPAHAWQADTWREWMPAMLLTPFHACRDGHAAGILEGRELGMQKGFEIGAPGKLTQVQMGCSVFALLRRCHSSLRCGPATQYLHAAPLLFRR